MTTSGRTSAPRPAPDGAAPLISGHKLAKNAAWNLFGLGLPLLAGVVAIPYLVAGLGIARFGLLTLAWVFIGYFSLFDLGLGRAVTKLVAERLGKGEHGEIPALAWTALALMAGVGLAAAPLIALLAEPLTEHVLNLPAELHGEAIAAFQWLAWAIPIVVVTTGLRGLLEAYQRFAHVNAIRIPLGLFNFLGPLAVLPYTHRLDLVIAVLVAGRTAAWAAHVVLCYRLLPGRPTLDLRLIRPLLGFGGWMAVSNTIGPLMMYLDRFIVGAVLSVSAVAYYATPYEVVSRLLIVPGALAGVLFPAMATAFVADRARAVRLLDRGSRHVFLSLFPVLLIITALAQDGMRWWLGEDFANHSTVILQWLAAGVLANGLAHIPLALIHGAGRPDLSTKLHALELALYLPTLWWLLEQFGIVGAALAWTLRAAIDAALLFAMARHLLPETSPALRAIALMGVTAAVLLSIAATLPTLTTRGVFLGVVLPGFVWTAWRQLLSHEERGMIRRAVRLQSA